MSKSILSALRHLHYLKKGNLGTWTTKKMITLKQGVDDGSVCFERLTRRLLDVSQLLKVLRSSLIEIQERCNFSRPSFFPHRVSTHQPKFWLRLNCKLRLSNHLLLHFTILLGNDSKYVGGSTADKKWNHSFCSSTTVEMLKNFDGRLYNCKFAINWLRAPSISKLAEQLKQNS